MSQVKKTGGRWRPGDPPTYFLAANMNTLEAVRGVSSHKLIAVNEIRSDQSLFDVGQWIGKDKTSVLIDSGVYWLAISHAKKHSIGLTEAINLPPDQLDNFDWLFDNYVRVTKKYGRRAWGYVEIDQGGRDAKIKTRAKLESLGLAPIPVYHPFGDGWDYFDELAQTYDRICVGNLVQADPATRIRIMATIWQRRRPYPNLWVHMLGLTPNEKALAYPAPSCDSTTWLSGPRWGQHHAIVANRRCWTTGYDLIYDIDHGTTGAEDAWRLGAYEGEMVRRTMAAFALESREVLGDGAN